MNFNFCSALRSFFKRKPINAIIILLMDRQKHKKIQNARIIATNIFMVICVLVLVFILIFVAQGYTYNYRSGSIEQSGLIQIKSHPSGATVKIDGETQFSHTEIEKMLSAGSHDFVITKKGYDTWKTTAEVDAGLLTRIEWVRLFPLKTTISELKDFTELRVASAAPNRKSLLLSEVNSNKLQLVNLQSSNLKITDIDLASLLGTDSETAKTAQIAINSWNTNSNRVILQWFHDDTTTWFMLNLDAPAKSINLSNLSQLDIAQALIANDSASKFWLLDTEQNLYSIENNSLPENQPLKIADNVRKIANNKDVVAYTRFESTEDDPDQLKRMLYIRRDGETDSIFIKNLGSAEASATFALSTYWDSEWILYSTDKNVEVLSGKYPSLDKPSQSLKSLFKTTLDFTPKQISVNREQRIIALSADSNYFSYDIENRRPFTFSADIPITRINWLDDFLVWHRNDDKIVVRDFDGNNRRELISDIDNDLPVIISANNKWLYYFDVSEKTMSDTSGQNNSSDSTPEDDSSNQPIDTETTTPSAQIIYTLKRSNL